MNSSNSLAKPILRGWIHAVAAGAAVLFAVALCVRSRGDSTRLVSCLVYGLSMIQLFSTSAIYHIGVWHGRIRRRLNALDHSNIFVLMAGTYTPLCAVLLSGNFRITILALIWGGAVLGAALSTRTAAARVWVMPVICVAIGWTGALALPTFANALPKVAISMMAVGGALYTAGAVIFALRWPNPFPRVFGFHEVFHLFTLAAAANFAVVVWIWVAPVTLAAGG